MNQGLSKYLQALAHELRGLPEHKREEEVREVRQHLEAIVARLMEGGLSEGEAVEAATSQFGAARKVGRELRREIGGREPARRVLEAAMCAGVCNIVLSIGPLLAFILVDIYLGGKALKWMNSHSAANLLFFAWMFVAAPLASGLIAGRMAPGRGLKAVLGLYAAAALLSTWFEPRQPGMLLLHQAILVWLPPVCLGAWASSRRARRQAANCA